MKITDQLYIDSSKTFCLKGMFISQILRKGGYNTNRGFFLRKGRYTYVHRAMGLVKEVFILRLRISEDSSQPNNNVNYLIQRHDAIDKCFKEKRPFLLFLKDPKRDFRIMILSTTLHF